MGRPDRVGRVSRPGWVKGAVCCRRGGVIRPGVRLSARESRPGFHLLREGDIQTPPGKFLFRTGNSGHSQFRLPKWISRRAVIRIHTVRQKKIHAMNEPIENAPNQLPQTKQRHGCLTAYLVVMIIANSATSLIYLLGSEEIKQNMPIMPDWAFLILVICCVFNLVCAIALFRWKKWGFWGFAGSAAVVFPINLAIGLGLGSALGGLIGVAILYGVLQIGKQRNGWSQLE